MVTKYEKKRGRFLTNLEDIRFKMEGELRMDFFSLSEVPLSAFSSGEERFSMD